MDNLPTGLNRIQIRALNFLTPGAASGQRYSEFRIAASTKAKNAFPYSKIIILKSTFIIILPRALKRIILLQKWNYLNLPSLLFPREKKRLFFSLWMKLLFAFKWRHLKKRSYKVRVFFFFWEWDFISVFYNANPTPLSASLNSLSQAAFQKIVMESEILWLFPVEAL